MEHNKAEELVVGYLLVLLSLVAAKAAPGGIYCFRLPDEPEERQARQTAHRLYDCSTVICQCRMWAARQAFRICRMAVRSVINQDSLR